jgi:hypothetical protein
VQGPKVPLIKAYKTVFRGPNKWSLYQTNEIGQGDIGSRSYT